MTQTKGYVSYVGENQYRGKPSWSFRLKNEEKWFNCGEMKPSLTKGDLIEFTYNQENGKYVVDNSSVQLVKLDTPTRPYMGGNGKSEKSEYQLKDEYWRAKEKRDIENEGDRKRNNLRIQYQSARNAAIELVGILVSAKAIKLPEKDPGAAIMGKVTDLTTEFYEACTAVGEEPTTVEFETEVPQ